MVLSAILSGALLAGALWAVTRYVFKSPTDDRLYVWVAIGAVVSRLLTYPLSGRRVPGLLVELISIVIFLLVSYGGYVYLWPGVPLHLR